MDYINSKYINFYNDQEEDLFVNDLSDMEKIFADFENTDRWSQTRLK